VANVKLAAPMPSGDGPRRPNRNYARGADFERKVLADLALNGYRVLRAAGSHGKADVIALKMGEVVLVQCKLTGPGGVRPAEWNALHELAEAVGATALIASRPVRGRIEYLRVLGPKRPHMRRPPVAKWTPDRIIEGDTW
jgi:Holliday junction resolvase